MGFNSFCSHYFVVSVCSVIIYLLGSDLGTECKIYGLRNLLPSQVDFINI